MSAPPSIGSHRPSPRERPARWLIRQHDPTVVGDLARTLGVNPPVARVLISRGYGTPDQARRFLRPSIDDLLDPYRLTGMREAVDRIRRAISQNEPILLYGDYDVDGSVSIVILKTAIELAGGKALFHVPHRIRDGYGMRSDVIDRAARDGIRLVISVDTGIRAGDVVRHASTLGIDVIVTDHHLPETELPPALAVLNPNRLDCTYPEKNLCGAGVAYKLCEALLGGLGWPAGKVRRMRESFLKLVAVATVADVVPLTGENRIIVSQGLAGFRDVRNPGLRALLEVAGFGPGECPSAGQVAFRLAPRINAAGRMADATDAVEMFLTQDMERARALAKQLHDLNTDRQQTEAAIVEAILAECDRVPVTDEQAALVFAGTGWHRGVVGIVASRIVERFCRPAFVLGVDESGAAQGSGRSVPLIHLLDALESMPEVFRKFGGHRQAAGVTLDATRIAEFRDRFNSYAGGKLTPDDFRPTLEVDATLSLSEINDASVNEILALAPFGFGNPAPLFAVTGTQVNGVPAIWNGKHLRMTIRQDNRTIVAKAWNFASRVPEFANSGPIDAVIAIEEDPYSAARGYPGWAVVVRDVRAAIVS